MVLLAGRANAEPRRTVRQLAYDARIDTTVTVTGFIWYVTSEMLKVQLVPSKCRWCSRTGESDALNTMDGSIRRALLWKRPHTAHVLSNLLLFGVAPASAFGLTQVAALHDGALREWPVDALLIAEASMLAMDGNQMAKYAFARERPFVHFLPRAPEGVRKLAASPTDDNLSFFSGHTTAAFALASSAGTVASLRGYRLSPLVWSVGLANALSVGYLRIAADKHYFSDVLVAALFGAALGAGIPLLFHRPVDEPRAVGPASAAALPVSSSPAGFSFSGVW